MKFDAARAWTDLQRQVGFGPRPAGTPALAKTRQYILAQLKGAGIKTQEQTFTGSTPAGPVAMTNVIGTIAGRRPERIVLASHYDTKRAPFRFVGANDGASSTAALLELGRALAASQPTFTIELLFLDGEEAVNWDWAGTDNTYGSRHYVQAAQKAGTLAGVKAAGASRHDRRPRSRHPARVVFHAVAGRRHLGRGRAHSAMAARSSTS